ncbi:MAG: DUF1573 domain-containing protein [Desulfomonile tiedjei]|uniref:DUF1573 domain-containing protein n=1 Tax=Desulfomonile tiedjei TaxID=2358 RepID=A0A9D6YZP4_9BACT|nr:DUF1573 domain-containing protein [Desulfomonile tiedjei]
MRLRILGVLPALLFAATTVCAAGGPSISFDKETHDYGRVLYGDTVTEEFIFTNTGDQPLIIEKLEASCGCTKAVKGSSEVPPNSKSKIIAAFDTAGLRAGKKLKTIFVHSNDPSSPVVKLTLLAEVIREVNVEPPNLVVRLPEFKETVTFPVKISNSSDKPVTVQVLRSHGESSLSTPEGKRISVQPRSAVPFNVVMKLKNEPGRYYWMGRMMMETDHPKEKELEIPYMVKLGQAGQTSGPIPSPAE